jgi:hypothetical protein
VTAGCGEHPADGFEALQADGWQASSTLQLGGHAQSLAVEQEQKPEQPGQMFVVGGQMRRHMNELSAWYNNAAEEYVNTFAALPPAMLSNKVVSSAPFPNPTTNTCTPRFAYNVAMSLQSRDVVGLSGPPTTTTSLRGRDEEAGLVGQY